MEPTSRWRSVWMIVMFDLPSTTKTDKANYRHFHDFLLDDGFRMLQYSVYGRHCISREKAESHAHRVKRATPPRGEVRILSVTEAQFGRMEIYRNFVKKNAETTPRQLEFW